MNSKFDAAILAGGTTSPLSPSLPNKNFIKIKGKPLFIHVLLALLEVKRFGVIYIVGPSGEIKETLQEFAPGQHKTKVKVMEESTGVVANAFSAFLDSIGGLNPDTGKPNPAFTERAFFVITGDLPLATHHEIDQFLDQCDIESYDYFLGMVKGSALDYYRTGCDGNGIRLAYTNFAEDLLRLNNMHLIKPLRVKQLAAIQERYQLRHLKNFRTIFLNAVNLIRRGLGVRELLGASGLVLTLFVRKMGLVRLTDFLRKSLTIAKGEDIGNRLLGTRMRIITTSYGGCALDVDKKKNIEVIEKNYQRWMEHQQGLAERPEKPSPSYQR